MTSAATGAPIRVLLAVGNRDLERRLVNELPPHGLSIAGRCLDAPSLIERSLEPGVDIVLVSADLHRLTEATLTALRERRRPVVLLTADGHDPERFAGVARVLPAGSSLATIAAALIEAEARGAAAFGPAMPSPVVAPDAGPEGNHQRRGHVIAVTSGKGAPGKTTIAIAFAAELRGRGRDVVLIDADLRGGNVAPHLDLDPRRGLVGLAVSAGSVAERIGAELQDGPGGAVLAGIERPELAASVRNETVEAAIATVRERAEQVVVDAGAPADDAVLRAADEVILVTGADLIAVWNARVALPAMRAASPAATVRVVVNRREGREHYDQGEIERVLGVPVLGVVREDRKAARRAIEAQAPLSTVGGRAARDLRALVAALEDARMETTDAPALAQALSTRLAAER